MDGSLMNNQRGGGGMLALFYKHKNSLNFVAKPSNGIPPTKHINVPLYIVTNTTPPVANRMTT